MPEFPNIPESNMPDTSGEQTSSSSIEDDDSRLLPCPENPKPEANTFISKNEFQSFCDQVSYLDKNAGESKPWYNQLSNLLDLAAILISIFTFIYVQSFEYKQDILAKKE